MPKSKSFGKLFTFQIYSYGKRTPIEILYRNSGKWQNMAQIDKKPQQILGQSSLKGKQADVLQQDHQPLPLLKL